jgi:hypothetical protein
MISRRGRISSPSIRTLPGGRVGGEPPTRLPVGSNSHDLVSAVAGDDHVPSALALGVSANPRRARVPRSPRSTLRVPLTPPPRRGTKGPALARPCLRSRLGSRTTLVAHWTPPSTTSRRLSSTPAEVEVAGVGACAPRRKDGWRRLRAPRSPGPVHDARGHATRSAPHERSAQRFGSSVRVFGVATDMTRPHRWMETTIRRSMLDGNRAPPPGARCGDNRPVAARCSEHLSLGPARRRNSAGSARTHRLDPVFAPRAKLDSLRRDARECCHSLAAPAQLPQPCTNHLEPRAL